MIDMAGGRVRAAVALAPAGQQGADAAAGIAWARHVADGRVGGPGASDAPVPAERGLASLRAILGRG